MLLPCAIPWWLSEAKAWNPNGSPGANAGKSTVIGKWWMATYKMMRNWETIEKPMEFFMDLDLGRFPLNFQNPQTEACYSMFIPGMLCPTPCWVEPCGPGMYSPAKLERTVPGIIRWPFCWLSLAFPGKNQCLAVQPNRKNMENPHHPLDDLQPLKISHFQVLKIIGLWSTDLYLDHGTVGNRRQIMDANCTYNCLFAAGIQIQTAS